MKQTAVEWLQDCLNIHFSFEQKMQFEGLFQQAKELEKQHIIDAFNLGQQKEAKQEFWTKGEQYYNETFNK
jgi:hypothetical protein